MARDIGALEDRIDDIVDNVTDGELKNTDAFERLLRHLCLDAGLSPSAARAHALLQLSPEYARKADAAHYTDVSGGAFRRTASDARAAVEAAERLHAVTRDDLPCVVLADAEIATGDEPVESQSKERLIIGEYLPLGFLDASGQPLQYVVFREKYARFSEQDTPDASPNRWAFTGTDVSRFEDTDGLERRLVEETAFANRKHQLEFLAELERAGFEPESTFSRRHGEGDRVVYEGDQSDGEVMRQCRGEECVVVDKRGPRSYRLRCPSVTDPDTGDPVEFKTVDYTLVAVDGEEGW